MNKLQDRAMQLFRGAGAYLEKELFVVYRDDLEQPQICCQGEFIHPDALFDKTLCVAELAEMIVCMRSSESFSSISFNPTQIDFVAGVEPWDSKLALLVSEQMRRYNPDLRYVSIDREFSSRAIERAFSEQPANKRRVMLVQVVTEHVSVTDYIELITKFEGDITFVVACWDIGGIVWLQSPPVLRSLIQHNILQWEISKCPSEVLKLPLNIRLGDGYRFRQKVLDERRRELYLHRPTQW